LDRRRNYRRESTAVYSVNDQILLRIGQDPFELYRFDEATQQFKAGFGFWSSMGPGFRQDISGREYNFHQWLWAKYPADKTWHLARATRQANRSYVLQHFNLNRIADYIGRVTYLEGDTIACLPGTRELSATN